MIVERLHPRVAVYSRRVPSNSSSSLTGHTFDVMRGYHVSYGGSRRLLWLIIATLASASTFGLAVERCERVGAAGIGLWRAAVKSLKTSGFKMTHGAMCVGKSVFQTSF